LLIKTTFTDPTDKKAYIEDIMEENWQLWKKLKPRFAWMKTLKSLFILGDCRFSDRFTRDFLDWVQEIQGEKFDLERLWTTEEHFSPADFSPPLVELLNGPTVKSFAMANDIWREGDLNGLDDDRFSSLEHLAELELYKTIECFENLTELKYIRGGCYLLVILFIIFCFIPRSLIK